MAEMGNKSLGGTLIEGGQEGIDYPRLYLQDRDSDVVQGYEVGDEVMGTVKVRISGISKDADGSRSAQLEVLELTLTPKEQPTAADKMYPTMVT